MIGRFHVFAILVPVLHGLGIVTAVHAVMKTRTSQGAIAWAFALITVPYLALPLYWVFGRDRFMGYVNAGAEASMVGAIADWFAVTALFKHPLGLPIPHTALIPRKKDDLGRSLEQFVGV